MAYSRVAITKSQLRIAGTYLVGVLVALIIGARLLGYDRDYQDYEYIYSLSNWDLAQERYEPGFRVLVEAGHVVGIGFPGFLILIALLSIVPKWRLIREYSFGHMLPYIYFSSYFLILQDSTAIRAGLAITCVFIGSHLFAVGRRSFGLVMLLLGLSFHIQVALVITMLGAFALAERLTLLRRNYLYVGVCLVGVAVLYVLVNSFSSYFLDSGSWVGRYLSAEDFYGAKWYQPAIVQSAILLFLGRSAIQSEFSLVRISWLVGLSGVISYYVLSSVGTVVFRLAEGLIVFNCLWIGYAVHRSGAKTRLLMSWCVFLFALFYFYLYYTDDLPYLRTGLIG